MSWQYGWSVGWVAMAPTLPCTVAFCYVELQGWCMWWRSSSVSEAWDTAVLGCPVSYHFPVTPLFPKPAGNVHLLLFHISPVLLSPIKCHLPMLPGTRGWARPCFLMLCCVFVRYQSLAHGDWFWLMLVCLPERLNLESVLCWVGNKTTVGTAMTNNDEQWHAVTWV